ncbi:MAG: nucleotidyltransferase family protein [Cyanobacteria bacterium P01_F01_bin.150]
MQSLIHKPSKINWQVLIAEAQYHGLVPILYQLLKRCSNSEISPTELDLLRRHVLAVAHFNQGLIQELVCIKQKFRDAGLAILTFKGPMLALTGYGDLSLRQSGDLDFLVASDLFETASQFLQKQGYKIHAEHTWAKCLRCDASKVEIDLHQNVAGFYLPFKLHFQDIWARRKQMMIAGVSFSFPCEEDLVVLLCVQFAKDAHNCWHKLIKACDIAAVINRSSLDWSLILEIAHQGKGDRPLKLGLSIVETFFGVELPPQIRAYAHSDWVVKHYCRCIYKEFFTARSTHRSISGLMWRTLFLFQDPVLEWQCNLRLVKLFIHSFVNKFRKWWSKRSL